MGKSEKRFNDILSTVTNAKNDRFKTSAGGREITLDNTERLLRDLGNGILDRWWRILDSFKRKYSNIIDDIEEIVNKPINSRNQEKIVKIISLLKEILKSSNKKSVEQPYTTDMPKLGSEESAAERRIQLRQGLKILTPDQMLSRLPIILAQLKAGNNSQKLINEIRELLYLYRSKKLTKTIFNHLINAI